MAYFPGNYQNFYTSYSYAHYSRFMPCAQPAFYMPQRVGPFAQNFFTSQARTAVAPQPISQRQVAQEVKAPEAPVFGSAPVTLTRVLLRPSTLKDSASGVLSDHIGRPLINSENDPKLSRIVVGGARGGVNEWGSSPAVVRVASDQPSKEVYQQIDEALGQDKEKLVIVCCASGVLSKHVVAGYLVQRLGLSQEEARFRVGLGGEDPAVREQRVRELMQKEQEFIELEQALTRVQVMQQEMDNLMRDIEENPPLPPLPNQSTLSISIADVLISCGCLLLSPHDSFVQDIARQIAEKYHNQDRSCGKKDYEKSISNEVKQLISDALDKKVPRNYPKFGMAQQEWNAKVLEEILSFLVS